MTWTKLAETFADDCETAGLSADAFRLHVEALCWTMRRVSGGRLTTRDVRRLSTSEHTTAAVDELLAVGFWVAVGDGYLIRHHMEHQPEPDLIHKRRDATAERVRKYRRRQAGLPSTSDGDQA
jgi:hypothetical protein